jgi:ribosomal protein L20
VAVDYRDTLVTYLKSETLDAAAKNLNISKATLISRIHVLRKAGVNIPKKTKKQLSALDVAQLNSIVKKHLKEESGI